MKEKVVRKRKEMEELIKEYEKLPDTRQEVKVKC